MHTCFEKQFIKHLLAQLLWKTARVKGIYSLQQCNEKGTFIIPILQRRNEAQRL